MNYCIGLLSGTSVDGIDAAVVAIGKNKIKLIATQEKKISASLTQKLHNLIRTQQTTLANLSNCDAQLGFEFSQAVNELLKKAHLEAKDIKVIGSHGQTIYHHGQEDEHHRRNTMQIGSAPIIAANTGINVVSNFRQLDMAYGGQGAPLAPIIHQKLFAKKHKNTAVINLGGIANVSFIGKDYATAVGYDTGPANCLLDEWISIHHQQKYDDKGHWARSGTCNKILLAHMLNDEYFQKPAPKSTGREYFNRRWYAQFKPEFKKTSAKDVQATLCHLTAQSIAIAIKKHNNIDEIIICGGGSKNTYLIELIAQYSHLPCEIAENSDCIEAILFAYLAYLRIKNKKTKLYAITGSRKKVLIGDICET